MASHYKRNGWYWLSYYENGKRHQVPLYTKDKAHANFKKNEIENKLVKGESPFPDKNLTAMAAFEDFKKSRSGRITAKTNQTDNLRIDKFLKDAGINQLSSITEKRLKDHLDRRIKTKKEGGDAISHRTANHTIRIIKTFLNWAVKTKLISINPIANMDRFRIETSEPRFLSHEEVRIVLKKAVESPLKMIIPIAIYTGMRLGEIQRLEWKDIDFENKIISVNKSKSKRFRKIPLHDDLSALLGPSRQKKGLIFEGSTRTIEWQFKLLKRSLEIEDFRIHDLRHTFASLLIKSGVDIYTVSKLLGHGQVTTTQIYAHLYQDHIQDAMKKVQI